MHVLIKTHNVNFIVEISGLKVNPLCAKTIIMIEAINPYA